MRRDYCKIHSTRMGFITTAVELRLSKTPTSFRKRTKSEPKPRLNGKGQIDRTQSVPPRQNNVGESFPKIFSTRLQLYILGRF